MNMKFACILISAASVSAFVPHRWNGAMQLSEQGLAANSRKNDNGGPFNIFDMVDDYWRDKKNNVDVGSMFGGVFPDAKLPSMPNLIDGFLKKQKISRSSSNIESVGDFDLDLANEIEAALAMAENDVAGGSVHQLDSREQQQQRQHPLPLNRDRMMNSANNNYVEAATAAATKAWLDNLTSGDSTPSNPIKYGYPHEEVKKQKKTPFFANDAEQYTGNDNGNNVNSYFGDSPFHRRSAENSSTDSYNSFDRFSAAAQTLADKSIRAGLEKKSVEETYKMYKQYFEQGVETAFDGGMDSFEAPSSLQKDEEEETKVFISDAAFDLAKSLRLDPYEIYQHKLNNFDGSFMVEENDVRNYLDLRYEAILSNNNLPKSKQESRKRESDNKIYEERDRARRDRTRANKSADYGRPRNNSEAEGNWQSYYDTYKQMADASTAMDLQNLKNPSADMRPRMSSAQPRPEPRQFPEQLLPKREQDERPTRTNYQPQKPRESQLSKLVYETKTEKINGPPVYSPNNRLKSYPEPVYQAQNSPPNGYAKNVLRDQNLHQNPSRGLGTNKNYPQDRSYRDTRSKNSIDMISNGNDEDLTYEEYNAYFAHNMQRPNNRVPPTATQSGSNLKGLLENRLDRNLHKQELYNQQQQRYLDERLQRDMERVSRLTHVQDQQRELESRLERNNHRRGLQHQQQELDQRLDQNIQRLSETTQKVARDAQRAIENAQKGWFGNQDDY
jgi:hypothetical protein